MARKAGPHFQAWANDGHSMGQRVESRARGLSSKTVSSPPRIFQKLRKVGSGLTWGGHIIIKGI